MIFRKIGIDAQNANAQIGILGKSFANIRRDLSNGQGLGVSIFGGTKFTQNDIAAVRGLNEALKQGLPIGQAWRANMSQCTAYAKQETKQYILKKQSLEGLIAEQKAASQSTALLTAKTIALNAAISFGIAIAIQGIIKGLDYLIHHQDKQREKLEELKQEYQELDDQLQSVQGELETTKQRIDELNAKDNLTFVEQEELDKLKETNAELERQQFLLEAEMKIKQREQNKQFVKTMNTDVNNMGEYTHYHVPFLGTDNGTWKSFSWSSIWRDLGSFGMGVDYTTSEAGYIQEQFNKLEALRDQYAKASTLKEQERIQKQIDKIEQYLADKSQEWRENADGIDYIENPTTEDEKAVNAWLDYIEDFRDRMAIAVGEDGAKTNALNRILDRPEFSGVKDQLEELGAAGELTGEKVKEIIPATSNLYKKLVELGVISADDTDWFDGLANTFVKMTDEAQNAGEALSSLVDLSAINKNLDAIQSAYSTLASARDEYNKYGAYSLDTVQALLELEPKYLAMLVNENGQLAINEQAMKDLVNAQLEEAKSKIYGSAIAELNALAERKAGEASETSAGKKANAVADINAETEALGLNTEAAMMNAAANAANNPAVTQEEVDAIVNKYKGMADTIANVVNGMNFDFGGTMSGFEDAEEAAKKRQDLNDKLSDFEKERTEAYEDYADKVEDINEKLSDLAKEEHANELKYSIDTASQALERFNDQLETFNTLADLTAEHDFTARLNNVRNQFTTTTQQGLALRGELERLMSLNPQTAEEYDMVASQMESIGNDYFEAIKQQRELRQELFDTKAEALEYLAETASDSASKALDSLNQAFDIVEKGSLSGGLFAQAPIPRVTKDAVEKQREENDKLIAEEQRYRDAIADIRKKALEVQHEEDIADFEQQREDLNEELEQAKEDLNEKLADIDKQIAETQAELSDINVHTSVDPLNTDGLKSDIAATQADLDNNPVRVKVVTEYQTDTFNPFVQDRPWSYAQTSLPQSPFSIGKAKGGAASGNVYVNEGRGLLAGQESMILPDGTFRLIGDGSPTLANVPKGTQILNAQDTADILARTGIKDGDKVERYADGTAKVTSRRSDKGIVEVRDGKVTAQDFAENTIKEINKAFDDVKDDISLEPVKTEFYQNASDPKFYDNLTQEIDDGIKGSLDEIVKDPANNIYRLILENSDWNALPEQIQSTLGEMGASVSNWNEWVQQPANLLKAMELLRGGDTSSWDLLSPTVQELLTAMGIDGVETWDEFVKDNPLQALQLLLSSWKALADSIQQWMKDCIAISQNGADAIHDIQIEAPEISQQSWDNLQTLIANKIQEILNAINETFGNSTVDLNFAINTSLTGTEQTNPQGVGDGNGSLVSTAEQFLGVPYVWGGTSPSGFDCSGLMQYVFAQNGISIPRTSQEQANFGTAVGKSELQPGDMVFFNTDGTNSHVGMYIGNGQFIHAPHTGDVVKISDLNSDYYTQHFSCARRVEQYATGTQDFGIAGENYKPEWAINKRTGEWSLIKKPTLFNKKEYDIVGEKVSEKIEKPIATYAKGTTSLSSLLGNMFGSKSKSKSKSKPASKAQAQSQPAVEDYPDGVTIDVPDGLGKYYTYMNWDTITNMDTPQGQLIQQAGKHYDSEGYGRVGERYALAMTSTFGGIGDYVDVYMANGRIIHGILADEKSQSYVPWDHNPANMWGHDNGQSIVEFVTNWVGHDNPPGDGGVLKVVNVGNYFGNPSFAGANVGADSVLMQKMRELQQKLQALMGTFKTNTHTVTPRVAEYKSLGNVRGKYDFSTPFTKHANGTKPLEVAGENNKPELMIDKRTKQISLIDSPTLIDTGKVDIVGEKDTARLNKSLKFYEEGTLSLSDDDNDETAITAEECAAYLKNINDHLEDGVTLNTEMYWDEQLRLISKGIDGLEEDEKISLEQVDQILRFEATLEDFEKSLDEISDSIDHYGKEYTDKWYAEMGSFTEQSKSVTDMIKEWRAGGTASDPDLRQFDEISKRATEVVDGHLRNMINLDIENAKNQVSVLNELANKAQDLYNTASTQDEQERAIEVIEQVREQQEEVNETFVSIMEQEKEWWTGRIERDDLEHTANISWIDKQLDEVGDKLDNATSSLETNTLLQEEKNLYDKKAAESQKRMDTAHANADQLRNDPAYADLFASIPMNEIFDADGEYNQRYHDILNQLASDPNAGELTQRFVTAAEILKEATHDYYEGQQDRLDAIKAANDVLSEMSFNKVEAYTDILERLNEIDEVRKGKQDAITAAMEKQHSLAQSLREETANITAELDANKHTEAYLDEDTRKLIFNDEDFEAEQKAINDIQAEATAAYNKYRKQVSELDETEWFKEQQLTDEHNKRMDILSEQLETEKQRIALKKKELEYNNALKERDTRIILGGRAVQVANPDTMYNLAKERSLAESDLVNTITTNRETEQERQSDRISQSIAQEISMREKITTLIGNMTDAEKELFAATLPVIDELDTFKAMLSPENIPWLNEHSRDYRGQFIDMDELYKHAGYDMSYNYAGAYDVVDKLHSAGILTDDQYKAMTGQLENQHNWKRATDINTSMYSYTNRYGAVRYDTESYGINDEAALADSAARDTAREYSRLITELNSGRGTQETLNRLKELNDTTATDNKYILNLLDTTQYAVNDDGVVIRRDSIDQIADSVGEIARGVLITDEMSADKIVPNYKTYVPDGDIARGNLANAYASGTTSAKRGLALTDEEGLEMKLRKFGGQYRMLEGGERIFTAEQTDKLLAFSRAPENFVRDSLLNNMQKSNSQAISNMIANDNRSEVHNHYDFGGVVVEHPIDADDLVSSLVRQANSRWGVTKNIKR